jgi:GT2 family glycosyltransferase
VAISGWMAGACSLQLLCNGHPAATKLTRSKRPDVAASLKMVESREGFGFRLEAKRVRGDWTLAARVELDGRAQDYIFGLRLKPVMRSPSSETPAWAMGSLEGASVCPLTGEAVVVGWLLQRPDVRVWLEADDGVPYSLEPAFRLFRNDVFALHGNSLGGASSNAGFILRMDSVRPGEQIRLVAECDDEMMLLGQVTCGALPLDPALASRWLLGLGTPLGEFHARIPLVDGPIIDSLIRNQQAVRAGLPVKARQLGQPVSNPVVTVIVPLYGRSDFVEQQLVEFARDRWFCENVELIYVLDDPQLVDPFATEAESLYRLYRIPFKWIWGGANRGFSGANNLGASEARAGLLLFLNSDAFPQAPGWLQPMLQVMNKRKDIGAVGPRLVHADGSIQHAGMEFLRREDLGIWVNHHPYMGLDPSLDPRRELTLVPAVTGACLLMRRSQFEEIGGWDTGYLIGDFEDSDLCLKLRSAGYPVAYMPSVQLTHLERQSFKLLGAGDFRTRVVIYNAVRHQQRWARELESAGVQA